KRVFKEGSSWNSPHNSCQRCMCKRGKIQCQDVLCPPVTCINPVTVRGECCHICIDTTPPSVESTPECKFNNQSHKLGTLWHPFLPPVGFDKCTTCTCKMGESNQPDTDCWRETCPPLDCDEREYIPPEEDQCCHTCPPKPTQNPNHPNDEFSWEEARRQILESGGCERMKVLYNNGDEYHPRIKTYGTQTCITCKCQNGKLGCDRIKCPELTCSVRIQMGCCEQCAGTRLKPTYEWMQPKRKKPKQIHKSEKRNYKKPYKKKSSC
ncbi:unnamed protein product, partial [Meganyctiphanes norvegica]